jgi:methionyl-tRNA formyltransferase
MTLAFLVAGTKGANFLRSLPADFSPSIVISRPVPGLQHDALSDIKVEATRRGWRYSDFNENTTSLIDPADLVFLVGWRHLISADDRKFIVMHDSLLPCLRGFNPTVTALILGETKHGVTAFRPAATADTGPICGQEEISISYPARVKQVYEMLGEAYARLAVRIIQQRNANSLSFTAQDDRLATYSLWRDDHDYLINWNAPADRIARFIDAVSWPYLGARTVLQGRYIVIDQAAVAEDLAIPLRQSGKTWSITNNVPTVVCGSGMLSILSAREADGSPVKFTSLRSRLG